MSVIRKRVLWLASTATNLTPEIYIDAPDEAPLLLPPKFKQHYPYDTAGVWSPTRSLFCNTLRLISRHPTGQHSARFTLFVSDRAVSTVFEEVSASKLANGVWVFQYCIPSPIWETVCEMECE